MRLGYGVLAFALLTGMAGAQEPPGVGDSFAALADQPATHTGMVFDRTAMQFAQGLLASSGGIDPERAAAALTGISIDTYRYSQPAFYSPEGMTALIGAYHAAGWKHLVNKNTTVAESAQPASTVTDVWLHFSGADVNGVTVLARAAKEMTVIRVTGDLRPLDLLHLGGHFGIPKVDPGAVMVPDGK